MSAEMFTQYAKRWSLPILCANSENPDQQVHLRSLICLRCSLNGNRYTLGAMSCNPLSLADMNKYLFKQCSS